MLNFNKNKFKSNLTLKQKKDFAKNLGLKIQCNQYFDYYLGLHISKDPYYETKYKQYLDFLSKEKVEDGFSYRVKKMDAVIDYIKQDPAFQEILSKQWNSSSFNTKKPDYKPNKYYLSLDLVQANWNIYKNYTKIYNTISWENFLYNKFSLHPFFQDLKSFRQFIFGKLSIHKRIVQLQKEFISTVYDNLNQHQSKVVGISEDELIFELNSPDEQEQLQKYISHILIQASIVKYPIKYKLFQFKTYKNGNENIGVKYYIDYNKPINKELFAVPKNKYWWYYKKYVLNKTPNKKDLIYDNDNQLSYWYDKDLTLFQKIINYL